MLFWSALLPQLHNADSPVYHLIEISKVVAIISNVKISNNSISNTIVIQIDLTHFCYVSAMCGLFDYFMKSVKFSLNLSQ